MGNASSAAARPAVGGGGDNGGRSGGGGGVFRLPLYRGERDAFLPISDDHHCGGDAYIGDERGYGHGAGGFAADEEKVRHGRGSIPPPLLSVEPKLTNNVDQLISPLSNNNNNGGAVVDGTSNGKGPEGPSPESSPPSVISSSESSYGTCYSSLSSSPATQGDGSADGGGIKSSWMHPTNNNQQPRQNRQRPGMPLLPIPLPKPVPKRDSGSKNLNDAGVLDCVKRPTTQPLAGRNSSTSTTAMSRRSSSGSLTGLFDSCMRSGDDGKNAYTNEEEVSYYSSYGDYQRSFSLGSSNRSRSSCSSRGSQGSSQYSAGTHNSYHLTNNASKASLVSAFSKTSAASQLSQYTVSYTEEELAMVDGDEPTPESDLGRVRNYHVVATAALPWRTGTAVNPLLRAAHLLRRNGQLRKESEARGENVAREENERDGHEGTRSGEVQEESDETGLPIDAKTNAEGDKSEEPVKDRSEPLQSPNTPYLQRRKLVRMPQNSAPDGQHGTRESLIRIEVNGERDGQEAKLTPLEMDKFGITPDRPSTPSSASAPSSGDENIPPGSPCSLDYSCFSFSEIGHTPHDAMGREVISPLGEEDSLLLSPFSPCEGNGARTFPPAESPGDKPKEEMLLEQGRVTLVLPWLQDGADRCMLYGSTDRLDGGSAAEERAPMFANQGEQEAYIRLWVAEEASMPVEAEELNIVFYPARYHKYYNSIFALGDICDLIPDEIADVCILEEPEHLNWYRAPGCSSWRSKFRHCIGVIHTNYKAYARDHAPAGFLAAPLLASVNSLVVQANCHRVVKLSGVLHEFAPMNRECIENVHGIRETYLEEGRRRRRRKSATSTGKRAYFIGKLLWAKGFDQMLELEASYRDRTGDFFEIDIFGSGPDEAEIQRAFFDDCDGDEGGIFGGSFNKWSGGGARRRRLPANFLGPSDHSSLAGDAYSIFINPSLTEVLCTTTAEAIAMNKWAIVPSHPSNAFFAQFPNCLSYRNRREFVSTLKRARSGDPPPLSEELARLLSWEAATARCASASAISKRDAAREERISRTKGETASTLTKTLSGLWSGGSKGDLEKMDAYRSVSSSSSSSSPSEAATGYGSVGLVTP